MTEQEELEYLKQNSPYALPDDPSSSGWSTAQIKEKHYAGLLFLYNLFKQTRLNVNTSINEMNNLLDTINTAYQNILNGTSVKAKYDIDNNEIKNTYAKITDIVSGAIKVLKYSKENGTEDYIYNIEKNLSTLQTAFDLLKTWTDALKNVNGNEAVLRAVQATKDSLGNVISDTYATAASVTLINTSITNIINGTTIVDKAYKDQLGRRIDTTYVAIANIVNALNDTSTNKPLSAAKGKDLQDQINAINALLASDTTTLDTLQEVVNYIKNNKSLIDGITINKMAFTDLVKNLTTNNDNLPLAASQGYALKAMIDAINDAENGIQAAEALRVLAEEARVAAEELRVRTFAGFESTINGKQDALTFDDTPTANSTNPVKSGGIKTYVDSGLLTKQNTLTEGTGIDITSDTISVDTSVIATKSYSDSNLDKAKKYADKVANDVRYELGGYTPSVDTDSTASYTKTAPSNAKGIKIVSVSGLCEKIAPSTTSDNTLTALKAIPTNTYTTQVDYVGGMSYKYNQLVQNGNFENNSVWASSGTLTISNNIATFTAISSTNNAFYQYVQNRIVIGHKYLVLADIKLTTATTQVGVRIGYANNFSIQNFYTTATTEWQRVGGITTYQSGSSIPLYIIDTRTSDFDAIQVRKFIMIDLTSDFGSGNEPASVSDAKTAYLARGVNIDEYNAYSLPTIRDTKTTSVVASANLISLQDVAQTTTNGITYKVENGAIYINGLLTGASIKIAVQIRQPIIANQDYYVKLFTSGTTGATNPKALGETDSDERLLVPPTTTFNVPYNINYFWLTIVPNTIYNNYVIKPMIVKGITEPSTYIPYVAPITKSIPASVQALQYYGMGVVSSNSIVGTHYNYIDLINKKFKFDVVDITINAENIITYEASGIQSLNLAITNIYLPYAPLGPFGTDNIGFSDSYFDVNNNNVNYIKNKSISFTNTTLAIVIRDDSLTSIEQFKALCPIHIRYVTANTQETDISSYIDNDFKKFITNNQYVQAEMVNEHNANLPSKVKYYGTIKEGLCESIDVAGETVALTNNDAKYGWGISASLCNTRNYDDDEGTPMVSRVDMGMLNWLKYNNTNSFYAQISDKKTGIANVLSIYNASNVSQDINTIVNYPNMIGQNSTNNYIYFYSDVTANLTKEQFADYMSNRYLYFERESVTPEAITPIEQYHNVEEDDVVTFTNTNQVDIPSTVTYLIEEERV